jgi:hypothetical protein
MKHAGTSVVGIPRAPLCPPLRSLAVSWFGRIGPLVCALAIAGIAVGTARVTHASVPADTLYGGGWWNIHTIDQNDASLTLLAHQPGHVFDGLAFDSEGRLFATGAIDFFFPRLLMELDPQTGEVVDVIGPVTDVSGSNVPIGALSVRPETDELYGLSIEHYQNRSQIWTIDKSTAEVTLVASEVPAGCASGYCSDSLGFAFTPDGVLYHTYRPSYGDRCLMILDPDSGEDLGCIPAAPGDLIDSTSIAVRSDGVIFSFFPFKRPRERPAPPPDPAYFLFLTSFDPLTGAWTSTQVQWGTSDLAFSRVGFESVEIDVKPGSDPNSINPSLEGDLPVAILGSDTFDVAEVDEMTLAFGPSGAPFDHSHGPHVEDVNGDGLMDMMMHFRIEETGIAFGDMEACVTGELLGGTPFEGCDTVRTVPDMDGDDLLDVEEAAIGTDALNPDTDGDGITDGQEVLVMGTDPLNAKDPKPIRGRKRRGTRQR